MRLPSVTTTGRKWNASGRELSTRHGLDWQHRFKNVENPSILHRRNGQHNMFILRSSEFCTRRSCAPTPGLAGSGGFAPRWEGLCRERSAANDRKSTHYDRWRGPLSTEWMADRPETPVDAIAEFRILTHRPTPNWGTERVTTNIITASGTKGRSWALWDSCRNVLATQKLFCHKR